MKGDETMTTIQIVPLGAARQLTQGLPGDFIEATLQPSRAVG
jgi:hypothetical protein